MRHVVLVDSEQIAYESRVAAIRLVEPGDDRRVSPCAPDHWLPKTDLGVDHDARCDMPAGGEVRVGTVFNALQTITKLMEQQLAGQHVVQNFIFEFAGGAEDDPLTIRIKAGVREGVIRGEIGRASCRERV